MPGDLCGALQKGGGFIKLEDIRDFVVSLGIVEDGQVYMGKLDARRNRVIGCYHLHRGGKPHMPIGGMDNVSYQVAPVSFLIHWNMDFRETEEIAQKLFEALMAAKMTEIKGEMILFIIMLVPEPQSIGADENGIYEAVIEAEIYTRRK